VEIAAAVERPLGGVVGIAGGHARPAAIDASRWMLLPLFQSKKPGKLRKDVRTAKVRVALVGDVLRQVAKPLQRRESGRRAALAAPGSRRTRPAVIPHSTNPVLAHGGQTLPAYLRCLRFRGFSQELVEDFRDLENSAIVERADVLAELC